MNFARTTISLVLLFTVGFLFTHCNENQELQTQLEFGNSGGNVIVDKNVKASSLTGFRDHVYPLTRQYCINCHSSQVPRHASSDVQEAHDQVIDAFKVNFQNTNSSRIVAKIRDESHACWSSCEDSADEMLAAVDAWKAVVDAANAAAQEAQQGSDGEDAVEEACTTPDQVITDTQEVQVVVDSLGTMQQHLLPVTVAKCMNCHDTRFPYHGDNSDALRTHDALTSMQVTPFIDFDNPANSELVRKVARGHNCTNGPASCAQDAAEIQAAIAAWATARIQTQTQTTTRTISSCTGPNDVAYSTQSLQEAVGSAPINGGTFQATDFTSIEAPFVIQNGFLENPNDRNGVLQRDAGTRGRASYSFTVTEAGVYEVLGNVQGLNGSRNSFYVSIDNGPLEDWHVSDQNTLQLERVTQTGNQDTRNFNLTAGQHTIHFQEREAQTKLQYFIIQKVNGEGGVGGPGGAELEFDLSSSSGIQGAKLVANFKVFDDYSYEVSNIRVVGGQGLYVKDLKFYVNGVYNPQHSTYTLVDTNIDSNDQQISPYSMVILKDLGEQADRLGVKFEIIQ